ncbi:hypothetical protein EJ06DRAFT_406280 [Trichodelitschia bisporula]|uniref:Uncharacterized protein n=1 Tax=Trichodelitschia bisporula TaxID=703511 RepID=A0A6G1HY41_9PEZI|nr:hypothetical protein EJ06DRAFT_406280 [Trichodelitschia bisporula]
MKLSLPSPQGRYPHSFLKALTLALLLTSATSSPIPLSEVDELRAEGLSERDILSHFHTSHPTPALERTTAPNRGVDTEGDVSPGVPQLSFNTMVFVDRLSGLLDGVVRAGPGAEGEGTATDAYEGMADEVERPRWVFKWFGASGRA